MQTAVLDKKIDLVDAAQRFVMNLTNNNAFVFNSGCMETKSKIMKKKKNGLGQTLQEIESFFFDSETPRSVIDYYNARTNRTLMQLFVCAQRLFLQYCMTSMCIMTPSMFAMNAYRDGPSSTDHVKFHPAFVNSPLKPETIETLFFDSHMCHSSFTFLPSASPAYSASTRVKMDDKTSEKVKEKVLFVPGEDAMAYESPEFTGAKDGCIKTRDRKAIVRGDFRVDKLLERVSSDFVVKDSNVAVIVMEGLVKTKKI
ncbi:hypothetical protein O3P69_015535 [Scylla paramamosain]|uniref:Uncharacterized protein n=1 Tax=Scylla paramamosain TaxID=85552 RepID=A0AAW0SFP6_SCYPA